MTEMDKKVRRIDLNFACCESTFWISFCALSGFIAVYLGYRGMSNTQIGLTTSLASGLAIVLQLILSSFMDAHPEFPIKKLITILFLIGIAAAGCVSFLPLPIAMMIASYSVAYAMGSCNNGYLNAQLVQFNNVGIPAHYGWPRGVGSISYALAAYVYGLLAERYTPDILTPCFMVGVVVCIFFVLLMPNPYAGMDVEKLKSSRIRTSYRQMLSGNPALAFCLLAILLNGIGNNASYIFILRIIEKLGGSTREYGVSEFIRAGMEMPALFASGLLLKRYKVKGLLSTSFFFSAVKTLVTVFAPSIGYVYLASSLNVLVVGLSTFSTVLLVNSIVRDSEKVRGQSLAVLCTSIGAIIGSAYGGWMIDRIGLDAMMLSSCCFSFAACAILAICCKPEKAAFKNE